MKARIARWFAWSLVALYVILAAIGLTLQYLSDTSYTDIAFPILLTIIPVVGIFPVLGALIISRYPRHPVGWLMSVGLLAPAFDMFFSGYASYSIEVHAGTLPAMDIALTWLNWSGYPFATTAFTLMILLFPDGRPLSPFWRNVTWTAVGTFALHLFLQAAKPGPADFFTGIWLDNPLGVGPSLWTTLAPFWLVSLVMLGICNLAAFVSLVARLRQAKGEERQQIKWLIPPAAGYLAHIPLSSVALIYLNKQLLFVAIPLVLPSTAGMVIATTVAIFKYRLYDIDIIINRSLVYGALTASVIAIYALIVGGLGTLVQGQGNLLISLLATGLIAVLFQPLRERLQRTINRLMYGDRDEPFEVLTRLGRRLEGTFLPEMVYPAIVETVAQALKLPYAAITVTQGEMVKTVNEYGALLGEPVVFSLSHQGEGVGHLLVGRRRPGEALSKEDERLLRSFARQAGTAVHAVQLTADLQRSRQQLVAAREEERLRLRRDLHDGLGPALASVVWQADSARDLLNADPSQSAQLLEGAIAQAQGALVDIRRLVHGLRPPALDELSLVGALEQSVGQHRQMAVTIEARDALPSLPAAVEVAAYRIVQEAIKNAKVHGRARKCEICLDTNDGLHLIIRDDGRGLPQEIVPGIGLTSMRERAEELGGAFSIQSLSEGGVQVDVHLPLVYEK